MFVGRIYKIKSKRHSQVYIGSTRKLLATRFAEHCAEYEKYKNGDAKYRTSFELIKLGDAWIELGSAMGVDSVFAKPPPPSKVQKLFEDCFYDGRSFPPEKDSVIAIHVKEVGG